MDSKDWKAEMNSTEPSSEAGGIHRRTFLKGLLAAGAVTSLGGVNLIRAGRAEAAGSPGGQNLYQKIIGAHLGSGEMKPGAEVGLLIDSTLTQDGLGVMAYLQYEAIGIPAVRTRLSLSYVDHQTLQDGFENADDHRYLESVADKYGILYSRPGNGICHQVHLERFSRPSWTLLGGDSHTPTCGAVGMLAMGAGGLDVAVVMGGGQFFITYPRVLRINLNGSLQPWVSAKDIVLEVLRVLTTKGNVGWAIEYGGSGLESLTVPERSVIANMGAEMGVTTSIFPSDEMTRRFLKAQQREDQWLEFKPDPGAAYDRILDIDLSAIEPNVALPHSPDKVKKVREAEPIKVDQVLIGSCTNSSYLDLMTVAEMLKGRKIHPGVSFGIAPGSRQVLGMISANGALHTMVSAGARILESACGFCVGAGQAPPSGGISVRTSNRNYPGRSGTVDAEVYLTSPATAVATALTGRLTDPAALGLVPPRVELPALYPVDDSMIVRPTGTKEVRRGPNIGTPPTNTPMPAELKARVAVKVGDKITTDHIAPSGTVNKYRSNIPKYSTFIFRDVEPRFAEKCAANRKEGLASAIVAGQSYGQGSSREHAALCPMYLGVRAVIAKSVERIHLDNLVNFGIVPLTFVSPADYDSIKDGDVLLVDDIQGVLGGAVDSVRLQNLTQGTEYAVKCALKARQRAIVRAGGLLNFTKTQGKG
jgi:aconitate hydratase